MRGSDVLQESLFTVRKLDDFVPASHALRPIRERVHEALVRFDDLFAQMYADGAKGGRPSIAPEKLLRAMLLLAFYSIRSERQLMEQVQYNLLFRWFVGLATDDAVWVPTVFSKNRDRLIEHDLIVALFNEVLTQADQAGWLSGGHWRWKGPFSSSMIRWMVGRGRLARSSFQRRWHADSSLGRPQELRAQRWR